MYRTYLDFFEAGERKRHWNVFDDIPWEKLNPSDNTERKALCVETFCAEECYLPDYSANGLQLVRSVFGAAWFQACWSYEESKHGLVFREYLTRSGMRSEADIAGLEDRLFAKNWRLPFDTCRRMAMYGALQEAATWLAYRAQRERAAQEGDEVLEAIFAYVSRDEAAHAEFYRAVVAIELSEDRASTVADFAHVLSHFKMPGDGLIADYQERLRSSGAGISKRVFFERAVMPLLKVLGTSRDELKLLQKNSRELMAKELVPAVEEPMTRVPFPP
jgi:acyl-[acyl-carrier-protein] desaturase